MTEPPRSQQRGLYCWCRAVCRRCRLVRCNADDRGNVDDDWRWIEHAVALAAVVHGGLQVRSLSGCVKLRKRTGVRRVTKFGCFDDDARLRRSVVAAAASRVC